MKTFDRFTEDAIRARADAEIGELMTSDASEDAFRMSERLLHLRRGLRALLDDDDRLDDALLLRGDRTNGGMR
jgi:hypothetical protein